MRFSFIEEGLRCAGIDSARILLIDCNDRVRSSRLHGEREQPNLANPQMMSWAEYLRREARTGGYAILDTSALTLDQRVQGSSPCAPTIFSNEIRLLREYRRGDGESRLAMSTQCPHEAAGILDWCHQILVVVA